MRIIVLGGHGFVGQNVCDAFQVSQHLIFPLSKRDGLDLTEGKCTESFFKDIKPEIIINCAANVGSLNYVSQRAADVVDVNMRMLSKSLRLLRTSLITDIF